MAVITRSKTTAEGVKLIIKGIPNSNAATADPMIPVVEPMPNLPVIQMVECSLLYHHFG